MSENKALRTLVGWLLVLSTVLSGYFVFSHWSDPRNTGGFVYSSVYYRATAFPRDQAAELGQLLCRREAGQTDHLNEELISQLAAALDPSATNFRFTLHTSDGVLLWDNTDGRSLSQVAHGLTTYSFTVSLEQDDQVYLEFYAEIDTPNAGSFTVDAPKYEAVVLQYGLANDLTVQDDLSRAAADYAALQAFLPFAAGAFLLLCVADAAALVYWLRRGYWRTSPVYRGFARLRQPLRAAGQAIPLARHPVACFLVYLTFSCLLGLPLYHALWRGDFWPIPAFPFALFQLLTLRFLLRWSRQYRAIADATRRMLAGEEISIDSSRFYGDLQELADALNSLSFSNARTVEREIRAQRFQAELITNVSHDLRSPLTSIINYVDLLKKAGTDSPETEEYLDVLDRKSQRLKKLTDDLIEASKASSGVLPVTLETLGLKELTEQAAAEYGDRFRSAGLELVIDAPDREVPVTADGRYLWRVVDNLLSNCAKYSLPGSRVYLTISVDGPNGVLSVKNISAQSLNIPADELLSRFVRGDNSRTDGGSGLGLSIAENLTKLQKGSFSLNIDGDLFKATLSLPLAEVAHGE